MNDFATIQPSGLLKNFYGDEKDEKEMTAIERALKKKRETMAKNRGILEDNDIMKRQD